MYAGTKPPTVLESAPTRKDLNTLIHDDAEFLATLQTRPDRVEAGDSLTPDTAPLYRQLAEVSVAVETYHQAGLDTEVVERLREHLRILRKFFIELASTGSGRRQTRAFLANYVKMRLNYLLIFYLSRSEKPE